MEGDNLDDALQRAVDAHFASLRNDSRWNKPGWVTCRQVVIAWISGMLEAANGPKDNRFYIPRYIETVGDSLHAVLRAWQGDIFESTPAELACQLRDFSHHHAVVRGWPLDIDAGVLNAMRYIKYQMEADQ